MHKPSNIHFSWTCRKGARFAIDAFDWGLAA
jgi:hypothetical protein